MQIDINCESPDYHANHLTPILQISRPMHLIKSVAPVLYCLQNTKPHRLATDLLYPGHLR